MAFDYIPSIVFPSGGGTTITFDFPPEGFDSEGITLNAISSVNKAAGGAQQTSLNYIEKVLNPPFNHVSSSIRDAVESFLTTHAFLGKPFDYRVHESEASSLLVVELANKSVRIEKMAPADVFKFTLQMRLVL